MDGALQSAEAHTRTERVVARALFATRWILAPFYLGLAISLLVLMFKFVQKTIDLLLSVRIASNSDVITNVLSLIDVSLVASLVLMVMFAGYENFVSRFDLVHHKYKPAWMGHVDFGDLKLKLLTSIVAIASIHVLEGFMSVSQMTDRELAWSVGISISFVVSGLFLALMNRIGTGDSH